MDEIKTLAGNSSLAGMQSASGQAKLEEVKGLSKRKVTTEKDVEKASSGFEALLLHQMLQSMWSTVDQTGMLGENSNESQIYRDMLNQALADSIAEGQGMGVKDFLKKELTKFQDETSNSVELSSGITEEI